MLLYGKKVTRLTAGHFCDVSKLIVYDTVNNDLQKKSSDALGIIILNNLKLFEPVK